jgi:glycosyltransferase involved in cell wall biosynthesis
MPDPAPPPLRLVLALNGDGLCTTGMSGGDVRTFEVLRVWERRGLARVHAVTTSGGAAKLARVHLDWPQTRLKASLVGTVERRRFYRVVSYLISALHIRFREKAVPEADAVMSSSDFFCDTETAACLKARRPGLRWVAMIYHLYTNPFERPGSFVVNAGWFLLQRWSLWRIARHADVAMVHDTFEGERAADVLVALGMKRSAVFKFRNGVDVASYPAPLPESDRTLDAVFVGQLRPNKGVFDFVPVWREVRRRCPDAVLTVIGQGSPEIIAQLESVIRDAGLQGAIVLAGQKSEAERIDALRRAKVFFMPSREEGWGIALCEAMAAGTSTVAWDLPVYRRHYSGVLQTAPCFDTEALAQVTADLLLNPDRRGELGRLGRERAAAYDWGLIAAEDWRVLEPRLRPS